MDNTSLTLLDGIGRGTPDAWRRLDHLYRPFLTGFFRGRGIPPADADDLAQDVLVVLVDQIGSFQHSGRTGAFRLWLRNVCTNRLLGYLRSRRTRGTPVGGASGDQMLNALPAPDDAAEQFARQHDHALLGRLFEQVSSEFAPSTMQAFRRLAIDAEPAPQVAAELKLSLGAVYVAKSRVLGRLRQLAGDYLDPRLLS